MTEQLTMTAAGIRAIRFTVLGRPQQKGSKTAMPVRNPRPGGPRHVVIDKNPKAKHFANAVSYEAHMAMTDRTLIRGPVNVSLLCYFARPKGHYGTGRNAGKLKASAPLVMAVMPDIDKLARCALDALTGIVFADDGQVAYLHVRKLYGEPERLEVAVHADAV